MRPRRPIRRALFYIFLRKIIAENPELGIPEKAVASLKIVFDEIEKEQNAA